MTKRKVLDINVHIGLHVSQKFDRLNLELIDKSEELTALSILRLIYMVALRNLQKPHFSVLLNLFTQYR